MSPEQFRGWACSLALSGILCAFSVGTAWAQAPARGAPAAGATTAQVSGPQCTNTDRLGTTQLRVSQQSGRALVELTRPDGAGRKIEISYGDELYVGRFDREGRSRMGFVLTEPKVEFSIRIAETPLVTCKMDVPDFQKIFRVTLRWRDPVQLDFHVIEPGRRMGDFGHVGPGRTNMNYAQGIGQMDVIRQRPKTTTSV